MAASDIIPQDGGQENVKLHPYVITLVRWCVSCLWSTASVLLQRLLAAPLTRLPQITAGKPPARVAKTTRAAGSEHLHPEPLVECAVLHAPAQHSLDVIFVHGLYGSLGNTWRQGEWRTKYKLDPTKVPLRNHSTEPCGCTQDKQEHMQAHTQERTYDHTQEIYEAELNENVTLKQLNGCFKKILPNENSLITEKFYNNTLLPEDKYETQAKFVTELFKNDCNTSCDTFKCNHEHGDGSKCDSVNCKCNLNEVCKCKLDVRKAAKGGCEAGCGCLCDACYSHCWPRDWIKEDFPGARVISVNYTSDPYLWRPLWVKGTKRLRLHERADQMMEQLLALGVGQRPIVWVGHSKGGLFIKQIYCEAYEAYLKLEKGAVQQQSIVNNNSHGQTDREYNNINNNMHSVDIKFNRYNDNETVHSRSRDQGSADRKRLLNSFIQEHNNSSYTAIGGTRLRNIDEMNEIRNNNNSGNSNIIEEDANNTDVNINCNIEHDGGMCDYTHGDVLDNTQDVYNESSGYIDFSVRTDEQYRNVGDNDASTEEADVLSSNNEGDRAELSARARLWSASCGFMFYSVPHRGSPLADIKTPLTSRSVELQEIAKDCPLVVRLQSRWVRAARRGRARVRSLVETGRTLMSVLWLRIVSEDSADAGVGVLHGVSVDHREICKPASRVCPLYTELTRLIHAALHDCRCV